MKQRKQNETYVKCRRAAAGTSTFLAVCLLVFGGSYAKAAPAALLSPSSVVYETTDENSTPLGNLVQGNTFELKESITAENGETWYLVVMGNGVRGYMMGEVSTDTGNAAKPEADNTAPKPQAEEENNIPDEAAGEEAPSETGEETVPETEEGTTREETTEEESTGAADGLPTSSNKQKKTYSIKADADRIREQAQPGQTQSEQILSEQTHSAGGQDSGQQKPRTGADKTLLLLLGIMLASAALIYHSYGRLLQSLFLPGRHMEPFGKLWTENSKARKKARKAKKKRAAKEAKKWKNNSLQK